jgi:hypothetical protein
MSQPEDIGLPEALERAAAALPADADTIRPANGDPFALLSLLDAEASTRILEWLLVHEPIAGGEIVSAWTDAGGEATERLLRIDPDGLPKVARKALRHAHHRLRSRGESVPEPDRGEVVATLPEVLESLEAASISALDPGGTRMAYLVEGNPSGGARMFAATLDEDRGVIELEAFTAGRGKIKKFMSEFARREDFPAVEAPPDAVRALIARIAAHQSSDRPLPRAFSEWRKRIASPPEGSLTPGELVREALAAEVGENGEDRARAVGLVREQKVGPWPPARAVLQEIVQRLNDVSTGVVLASGGARQAQLDSALDEAVEQVYEADFGQCTARRFDETAYVFWQRDRLPDARACLAAATAFRDRAPDFRSLGRAMLEVVLAPVLKSIERSPEGPDNSAESLLVRP